VKNDLDKHMRSGGQPYNQHEGDAMTAESQDRRGLRIFRAEDAPTLEETGMMAPTTMRPGVAERVGEHIGAFNDGSELHVLYGRSDDAGSPSLVHVWFKPNYPLPRHSHDVDCLYYVVSGTLTMGNQVLHAGDGFFVPADAPYQYSAGPDGVEVLEFRNARTFDIKVTEDDPARWDAMIETATQQRDAWRALVAPPAR
jgi:quercetin dioxygenase-like cupin family protein